MKEISATDAARGFSAMLDAVEHDGETFVVTRSGKGIARIGPAGGASGAAVKTPLRPHRVDSSWSDELRVLREAGPTQDRDRRD